MFCPKCATENPDNGKFCRGCRANLSNVLAAVSSEIETLQTSDLGIEIASLYSSGIRNVIIGMGFLTISLFIKLIPPENGLFWVLFMLPAIFLTASGVSRILKSEGLKKVKPTIIQNPTLSAIQQNKELPPIQSEYVSPRTKFATNDLMEVPSVTENTTRQLQIEDKGN